VLGPLLNEYFAGMTDIVFAHDGTVAKIVDDALHVLFGAPGEQSDHADRAVACALALDDYAQSFRERCHKKGIPLGITPDWRPCRTGDGGEFRWYPLLRLHRLWRHN
jgi:adenylate cyclase